MIDTVELEPLVTVAEMYDLPGGPKLTQARLDSAADEVRGACGWHIAPVRTATLVASGTGAEKLRLPTLRTKTITAVRLRDERTGEAGRTLTDWRPLESGLLYRRGGWPRGEDNVLIEAEHGFDTCPRDLRAALLALAEAVGETSVGVASKAKTVGRVTRSASYFAPGQNTAGAGLPLALAAVLDRYRLPA